MKIDRSKLKKSSSEVVSCHLILLNVKDVSDNAFFQPADCKALIDKLKACSEEELLSELKKIEAWTYGKCELYHWVDVLDLCDSILEKACRKDHEHSWVLACDLLPNKQVS